MSSWNNARETLQLTQAHLNYANFKTRPCGRNLNPYLESRRQQQPVVFENGYLVTSATCQELPSESICCRSMGNAEGINANQPTSMLRVNHRTRRREPYWRELEKLGANLTISNNSPSTRTVAHAWLQSVSHALLWRIMREPCNDNKESRNDLREPARRHDLAECQPRARIRKLRKGSSAMFILARVVAEDTPRNGNSASHLMHYAASLYGKYCTCYSSPRIDSIYRN